jgi:hypothetical protein
MRIWSSTLLWEKRTSNLQADDGGATLGLERGDLGGGEFAVGSVVARRKLGGELRFAHRVEFFGGLEGAIGGAVGEQDRGVLAVDLRPLRLTIGAVGAADVGAFVPGEAEPVERVEDLLLGGGDEAGAVGVFDAEDELAATLAGVDEVEQADVGGADVGVAGGRGSDADSDWIAHGGTGGWGGVPPVCR